jgi:hypothetical protein
MEVVKILLAHGADPCRKGFEDKTPAEWARHNGFVAVAELVEEACRQRGAAATPDPEQRKTGH